MFHKCFKDPDRKMGLDACYPVRGTGPRLCSVGGGAPAGCGEIGQKVFAGLSAALQGGEAAFRGNSSRSRRAHPPLADDIYGGVPWAACCSSRAAVTMTMNVTTAKRMLAPTQVGLGDDHYKYTELLAISQRFKQSPSEPMTAWILRVYDQGGSALALTAPELTLLGTLTGDAVFNYHCKGLQGSCQVLLAWLLQAWRQRWKSFLHFEGAELPFRPWAAMEEGIQLVRELGMLAWIYHEPASAPAPEQLPRPAPEDLPFTHHLQRHLLMAAPPELRVTLVSVLVKGMTVLEVVMQIRAIADIGLLWRHNQPGRAKLMLGPNPTRKDLLGWLLSHGVPKEKVEKLPTKVLLELYVKEAKGCHSHLAYMLGEEQPTPYSDQACGEEQPMCPD
ncbi:uncharacterized protein AAES06_003629 isoform 2-T3 [Glossophaga mutica]